MSVPSLKNRKPVVYVFFSLFVFFGAFFLAMSCVPGSASSNQSNWVANLLASFVNVFEDTSPATKVEPSALLTKDDSSTKSFDSSFLNLDNPSLSSPKMAVGSTTRLTFSVDKPELNKGEYVDPSFTVTREDGSDESLYTINIDPTTYTVRLVSRCDVEEDKACKVLIQAGDEAKSENQYEYSFDIVKRQTPYRYEVSAKDDSITLSVNETYTLDTELLSDGHDESYLERYYDKTLLEHSPISGGISVDEYGVIHAYQTGTYVASYGGTSFNVTVNGSVNKPSGSLSLSHDDGTLHIEDYDHDGTGVNLQAVWSDEVPDSSIRWESSNEMIARVIVDTDDSSKCTVKGYREAGEVTISAISNADNSIKASYTLSSSESVPDENSFNLVYSGKELPSSMISHSAKIVVVTLDIPDGVFVSDKRLTATSDNENAVEIDGNGTQYIALSFHQVGDANITIQSVGNQSLKKTISVNIQAELNQDPDDPEYQMSVRKIVGHLGWFTLGGAFGTLFFYFFVEGFMKKEFSLLFSSLSGLLVAGLSEMIQMFIPGRGATFTDIGIDFGGYMIGLILSYLGILLVLHIKKKKKGNAPSSDQKIDATEENQSK
ncbi:MAG: VanZ family protein [Bacilli bacterium]|jgi:VanZ family protein|nr:VanZ family protein [Bacilli bacterium]MCH4277474.1 VanZ family protein [Bacilli bacterium]